MRLVSNYGRSETLPDCKFACEKDIYCTDKAWVTSKLRNHKVYADTEVKCQQFSYKNVLSQGTKPMSDKKCCPINNNWASAKVKVKQIFHFNVNAPEFVPGNNKKQYIKVGCNVFAKVFSPKNRVNTCHLVKPVNASIINNNANIESNDTVIQQINRAETLGKDFTSLVTSASTTANQSTSVLNSCDIYDRMISTTANSNKIMLKNISSTSRPCDTVSNNQQSKIISSPMSDSRSTWLSSINTDNCHNEVQEKYVETNSFTTNTSIQEYSSLYTWLVGESDKGYSDINIYTGSINALQSISRKSDSLQDMLISSQSFTAINPHNTTMHTSINTVCIQTLHSDNQNDIVKYKNTTHEAFTPALGLKKDIISDIHYSLAGGHFSNFSNNKNTTMKYKCTDITWEAEFMNFTQFHTDKPYVREFGFLPLEIIHMKVEHDNGILQEPDMCTWIRKAQKQVENSGVCNYQGVRIPVPSGLKIYNWRNYLKHYDFQILSEYLHFGFPLSIDYNLLQFNNKVDNHPSAYQYTQGVDKYFKEEVKFNAMVGPMKETPFAIHYSPLMARSKPDGGTRVIVDLSWPIGASVNNAVPDDYFDFFKFQLKYPTVDNIVHKIRQLGPDTLLYKIDLQRAFRNLRVDPLDYKALGLRWRDVTYVDVGIPFGLKQGAASCQFSTDAITYLMWTQRHFCVNYLDDVIGVSPPPQASSAFSTLMNLLEALGLPVNFKKVEKPQSKITCLGIDIDARNGILTIPDRKMEKIRSLCTHWRQKTCATRNQLQKLLGNLLHIHRCVKPARLFTNRMLQTLRTCPKKGSIPLNNEFFKDLNWFSRFLKSFNGSVEIHTNQETENIIYVDSSLQEMGAYYNGQVYSVPILQTLRNNMSIVHFEAANIVLTLKCWGKVVKNSTMIIWCDNFAVVNAFTHHKIRDVFLMACVRTVWLICAENNIKIQVKHIRGIQNTYADILSRWSCYKSKKLIHVEYLKTCKWMFPNPCDMLPDFDI